MDTNKLSYYGLNQTSIYLARYSGDKVGEANEIVVSSVLLPPSGQSASGGTIKTSSDEIVFEKEMKKMKAVLTVTNEGTSPLKIHNLQVFNHAVEASLSDRNIPPGKSVKLKVSVKRNLLERFKARPRILLVSDDAKTPVKIINITISDK